MGGRTGVGKGAAPQSEAKRERGQRRCGSRAASSGATRAPSVVRGGTHSSVELCVCVHAR